MAKYLGIDVPFLPGPEVVTPLAIAAAVAYTYMNQTNKSDVVGPAVVAAASVMLLPGLVNQVVASSYRR